MFGGPVTAAGEGAASPAGGGGGEGGASSPMTPRPLSATDIRPIDLRLASQVGQVGGGPLPVSAVDGAAAADNRAILPDP
eukprot:SAG11_NODE_2230_length_3658_cov_2.411071_3_plen_80_part_00